ncbi:hypothetical protein BpHYR1_030785 [Brachionus plicatilis]|uniref:Uncharacterized protein n=1 Tax=Brachionus plicatilis TaxID=10195 RepID=A0A3M7RJ93_BRAPC|nr:hypothetical protein BpHYR1_030785 [Brachionus plicatilis]
MIILQIIQLRLKRINARYQMSFRKFRKKKIYSTPYDNNTITTITFYVLLAWFIENQYLVVGEQDSI